MILITILFLILTGCILTHSQLSLFYASAGLELWFKKMIPSLLPFMILSGIMVRLQLTEKISMLIYPLIKPLFRVRKNVCYCMLIGFLCGFPMGARTVAELYGQGGLNQREASYLLAFCNNIGPVYFCSFALPLLGRRLVLPYLFGMYGIPLLYGLILRYTVFRCLELTLCKSTVQAFPVFQAPVQEGGLVLKRIFPRRKELHACSKETRGSRLLLALDESIRASIQGILTLGGYMILFNLMNLLPHILLGHPMPLLAPALEITGGLSMLGTALPLYSLLMLSFGGLCCIAQTYSSIRDTGLSTGTYVFHKVLLTLLNGGFYLLWYLIRPISFLC